jgi:hypothetical protein
LKASIISTASHFPSRSQPIIQSLIPVSKELFLWKFLQVVARHCRALLRGGAPATIAAANSIPHNLKNFTNASHQKLLNRRNSAGA